jgi:FdhD protein
VLPASAVQTVDSVTIRDGALTTGRRELVAETPVAFTHLGSTLAVMLATPSNLDDFALGFCFSEGVIDREADLEGVEQIEHDDGVELRLELSPTSAARFTARRRSIAGPTGCGLCGIESLAEAMGLPRPVTAAGSISQSLIAAAIAAMNREQVLHARTRAAHGAGLWDCRRGVLVDLREDVGRHNALDKLAGASIRAGRSVVDTAIVLTSRISVELVQKTARLGVPVLIAMSAPTSLAVDAAERSGITLIGVARGDVFEAFARGDRLVLS